MTRTATSVQSGHRRSGELDEITHKVAGHISLYLERGGYPYQLLREIRHLYSKSDGVHGSLKIWDDLSCPGETCSLNRVARLI